MASILERFQPPPRPPVRLARPGKGKALTAAGATIAESPGVLRRLDLPWQQDALSRYDDTGECWNPAQYQARAMERIRYFPALRQDDGTLKEVTDGKLLEIFNRIRSPGGAPGDLSEIAGQYARLQFVIGDGLLTVSDDEDQQEAWEYLSTLELRVDTTDENRPQSYRRLRAPGLTPQQLFEAADTEFETLRGERAWVRRLWKRHPSYSQWADSPVRPILDLYALLNRLTLAVMAEASSRAAQRGLVFWPNELTIATVQQAQGENPNENPVAREFEESMARSIANPGTAEAMAPFFVFGPGVTNTSTGLIPTADLIKWIQLGPSERYLEGEMWEKTISRIAGSLDLPKEMLTGIEDVSHWSAWFLDEVGFRQHTGPTVVRFTNDIASVYLRPTAIKENVENADRVTIGADASEAINHPDETGVAMSAHDRLAVSDKFLRRKIGANEGDKPDAKELERRTSIKLRVMPSDMQRAEGNRTPAGQDPPPPGGPGDDKTPPGDTTERPPGTRSPSPSGPNMSADLSAMVIGAAQMQIDRAREYAGSRLLRLAQRDCADCKEKAARVSKDKIAATLGQEQVHALIQGRVEEAALMGGVGNALAVRMREWGIDGGMPEQIGQIVEQHALRGLYELESPPLPWELIASIQRACG